MRHVGNRSYLISVFFVSARRCGIARRVFFPPSFSPSSLSLSFPFPASVHVGEIPFPSLTQASDAIAKLGEPPRDTLACLYEKLYRYTAAGDIRSVRVKDFSDNDVRIYPAPVPSRRPFFSPPVLRYLRVGFQQFPLSRNTILIPDTLYAAKIMVLWQPRVSSDAD